MDDAGGPARVLELRAAARGGRVRVRLDDGREVVLSKESCARGGLRPGLALAEERLAAIVAADGRVVAHETALALLAHRARSTSEVRQRLGRRGIDGTVIEVEVARLQRAGLLDDEAFARAWVEERRRLSPRGRRMLRFELRRHGIGEEEAAGATGDIDDRETALALARQRARTSSAGDFRAFASRVGGFLQRRGFDHPTVVEATRIAWQELGGGEREGDDGGDSA